MPVTMSGHSRTEALAQHLLRPVDAPTRDRARLHLIDWLGCVAGARRSEAAAALAGIEAPSFFKAAFLGNVLEMDDVHRTALLHPGPVIWPVALDAPAVETLDDALVAAVRGYEAMIAVGATFDDHHYVHYHPTATAGVFGAAAAEACAATADPAVVAHAPGAGGVGQWRRLADATQSQPRQAVARRARAQHRTLGRRICAERRHRAARCAGGRAGAVRRDLSRAQADGAGRGVADRRGELQAVGARAAMRIRRSTRRWRCARPARWAERCWSRRIATR